MLFFNHFNSEAIPCRKSKQSESYQSRTRWAYTPVPYPSTELWVEKDGEEVNGKSIMSLMMLAAGKGSELKFIAQGDDAQIMLDEIEALFNRKFDEE